MRNRLWPPSWLQDPNCSKATAGLNSLSPEQYLMVVNISQSKRKNQLRLTLHYSEEASIVKGIAQCHSLPFSGAGWVLGP